MPGWCTVPAPGAAVGARGDRLGAAEGALVLGLVEGAFVGRSVGANDGAGVGMVGWLELGLTVGATLYIENEDVHRARPFVTRTSSIQPLNGKEPSSLKPPMDSVPCSTL